MIGVVEKLIEAFDKLVEGATEADAGNTQQGDKLVGEGYNIIGNIFSN